MKTIALLPLLAASLFLQAPARADYRSCALTNGAATCAGWTVGAAVCYDRAHPWQSPRNSTVTAVNMLREMGIHIDYIETTTARAAAAEFIAERCPH